MTRKHGFVVLPAARGHPRHFSVVNEAPFNRAVRPVFENASELAKHRRTANILRQGFNRVERFQPSFTDVAPDDVDCFGVGFDPGIVFDLFKA